MDVARDHPDGRRGYTPQPTTAIRASFVAGLEQDFIEHQPPHTRVDDVMQRPDVAAVPGYFRDETMLLQLTGAASRMRPEVMRHVPDPRQLLEGD